MLTFRVRRLICCDFFLFLETEIDSVVTVFAIVRNVPIFEKEKTKRKHMKTCGKKILVH